PQAGAVPGEQLSPTQPFPVGMPPLAPQGISLDDAWGFTPIDRWLCRRRLAQFDLGPIYTPVSERGTVIAPPLSGGANWGGGAWDPRLGILVVPTNRVPAAVRLVSRANATEMTGLQVQPDGAMKFPNVGSPWAVEVIPLLSPLGAPCVKPPWAALTAVDIVRKRIVWEIPLGSIRELAPVPLDWELGTPGAGAPLATAGGVTFIGYTSDKRFRALETATGRL